MTPQEIDSQVASLEKLINEKFDNLNHRIDEFMRRFDEHRTEYAKRLEKIEDKQTELDKAHAVLDTKIKVWVAVGAGICTVVGFLINLLLG